jgi:hypothetical protein
MANTNLGPIVARLMAYEHSCHEAAEYDYLIDYGEWSAAANERAMHSGADQLCRDCGFDGARGLVTAIRQRGVSSGWLYRNSPLLWEALIEEKVNG